MGKYCLVLIGILITMQAWAQQNVGIGTKTPDGSAALEIKSPNQGLLIPRMDSTARKAISSPAIGLMVFDSTSNSFWYFDGAWTEIRKAAPQTLSLSGDTLGISGGNNVILNLLTNGLRASDSCYVETSTLVNEYTSGPPPFGIAGNLFLWQSFTTTSGGYLTSFVFTTNDGGNKFDGGILRIYNGQDTVGTLLYDTTITALPLGVDTVSFPVSAIYLSSNTQYTFYLKETTNDQYFVIKGNDTNPYGGGRCSAAGDEDIFFTAYLQNCNTHYIISPITSSGTANLSYIDTLTFRDGTVQSSVAPFIRTGNTIRPLETGSNFVVGNDSIYGVTGNRVFFDQSKGAFGAGRFYNLNDSDVGDHSIALGYSIASGSNSAAIGYVNTASGNYSTAMGLSTIASAEYSTAIGLYTLSRSEGELAVGMFNTDYTPNSTSSWNATDRLFTVGNGSNNANRSDALVILKNGNMGIGTSTPDTTFHLVGKMKYQDGNQAAGFIPVSDVNGVMTWTDPSAISTPSIFELYGDTVRPDTNVVDITTADFVFGSPQLDYDGSNSWGKFFFDKTKGAFRAGSVNDTTWNESQVGIQSFAAGFNTTASGNRSTAFGQSSVASGNNSFVTGGSTTASGDYSFATGVGTKASGLRSFAIGQYTEASGSNSIAFGSDNKASGYSSIAGGLYSTASGNYAIAFGGGAEATGNNSIAIGQFPQATGDYSIVMGKNSKSSGKNAVAIGFGLSTPSYGEAAFGLYNTTYSPTDSTSWSAYDRLFTVGNGTGPSSHSDALVILKNGNMGLGTSTPDTSFHLVGKMKYQDGSQADGHVLTSDSAGNASWQNVDALVSTTWDTTGNDLYNTNSGKVGIGIGSPSEKLDVNGNMQLADYSVTFSTTRQIKFSLPASSYSSLIESYLSKNVGSTAADERMTFYVSNHTPNGKVRVLDLYGDQKAAFSGALAIGGILNTDNNWLSGDGDAEGLKIDNSGNVSVGTNAVGNNAGFEISKSISGDTSFVAVIRNTDASNASGTEYNGLLIAAGGNIGNSNPSNFIRFQRPDGTTIGKITQNGSAAVNYNSTSDERLKTAIQPTQTGLDTLMQIQVKDYRYIDNPDLPQTGFVAQQLYQHYPMAVTPGGADPKTDPWMVDYSKLTPLLVKAVQDQQAQIAELKRQNQEQSAEKQALETQLQQMLERLKALEAQMGDASN